MTTEEKSLVALRHQGFLAAQKQLHTLHQTATEMHAVQRVNLRAKKLRTR